MRLRTAPLLLFTLARRRKLRRSVSGWLRPRRRGWYQWRQRRWHRRWRCGSRRQRHLAGGSSVGAGGVGGSGTATGGSPGGAGGRASAARPARLPAGRPGRASAGRAGDRSGRGGRGGSRWYPLAGPVARASAGCRSDRGTPAGMGGSTAGAGGGAVCPSSSAPLPVEQLTISTDHVAERLTRLLWASGPTRRCWPGSRPSARTPTSRRSPGPCCWTPGRGPVRLLMHRWLKLDE